MKIKKVLKNQKPIEYDIHLKYLCIKCGDSHWLSFKEASTKGFKIVCDCGNTFSVKRVENFSIKYYKKHNTKQQQINTNKTETVKIISDSLLDQSIEVLVKYGFTKIEAKNLILKSYYKSPSEDVASLVKQTLESLRNINVN
jgi:DNA-directed RNA polymerase subunit RPC12/RpoP